MIVYVLFVRGTFCGVFKTEDAAKDYANTMPEEDQIDAWIVPEDVKE